MASTSAYAPAPPPLFDQLLRSSMDFMVSNPRDSTSSSLFLLYSRTPCILKSHFEDLIHNLKYLFTEGLITLQIAINEEVDPTTTLATLASLMAAISRTTNSSSESIALSALEDLRQLTHQLQQLQQKLSKCTSGGSYLGITSTVVIGGFAAAFAMPSVGLIPVVQPLAELFGTLWKERMINPLERKLKVVEANRFIIHSMIIKVGKMKDMVQALVMSLEAKRKDNAEHDEKKLLEELENALVDSLTQLQMVELEFELEI